MNRLAQLQSADVSIWLDTLSRDLLTSGEFERLRRDLAVTGATSNPTIFAKAICGSGAYDDQLTKLIDAGVTDPREQFLALALDDVRAAARQLRAAHSESRGTDGFVSFEVTPDVADDVAATVEQAVDIWQRLDAPNVMVKVPATDAGIEAIEALTGLGVNVNVTLLFAVERYAQVIDAYLRGLEHRAATGEPIDGIRSVASFFVSRVDAKADRELAPGSPLRGHAGIANARAAYALHRETLDSARWQRLAERGASPQRPLWASTAPKDPAYRDVLYLEELALPGTILTVPQPTLEAFADHGVIGDPTGEPPTLNAVREAIDLGAITNALEREGVGAFGASYRDLLACVEDRARHVRATTPAAAA